MTPALSISLNGRCTFGDKVHFTVDMMLTSAQWTCLLGPSGVGKSTVLRLIAGLAIGGDFDGTVQAEHNGEIADQVSYMAQSDLLLPWLSVAENVVLGARLRGAAPDMARADDLLAQVGLSDHRDKRPAALSGGMRQRVALARTLMEDRPVVLLDEPFSALDAATRAEMQELAYHTLAGKTVLLVTHDPAEAARLGHQILLMAADGMTSWPTPDSQPIRAFDDRQVVQCQVALLAHLRKVQA